MEKIICIYKIINIANKKIYVGSAIDFGRRKRRHFNLLRKGEHHSLKLQNSFKKHGEDKFIMEIIEIVTDKTKLIEIEQKWIDSLKPEFNMTLIAGLNSHLGLTRSQETKDRISKSLTGKKQSPEHVESNRKGHLGLIQSEVTKSKRSETCKNSPVFQKAVKCKKRNNKIKKTRIKNGGYVVSDEMKKQISKTLKEQNLQSAVSIEIEKYDLENNLLEIYPSMLKAEVANNFGKGSLYYNLIKKNKKEYKGFNWKINK